MAAIPPEQTPWLALVVDPSLAYLESPWPIDEIWRANQPERDPASVDLAAGGARLEVRRRADGVVFRALDPPTFAFRQALARGATLTEAAELAFERQGDFPLAHAVRALLDEEIAVDLVLTPPREVRRCP